jgi:hypothetical protein
MKSAEKVVLYRLAASLLLTALTLQLLGLPAWPHGGGLDAYACHHDRPHGGYHCHRGPFRVSLADSQTEMLQPLEGVGPDLVTSATSTSSVTKARRSLPRGWRTESRTTPSVPPSGARGERIPCSTKTRRWSRPDASTHLSLTHPDRQPRLALFAIL